MSNQYTDGEMLLATQIAYLDIPKKMHGQSLSKWIEQQMKVLDHSDSQYSTMEKIMNMVNDPDHGIRNWESWKVVDVCDHNHVSGMYATLIDNGSGDAIIGFRGSESENLGNIVTDWVASDLGLLNNTLTPQQADAEIYTDYLWSEYGDKYDSFSFSGHSLGGNLAMHAAINAPVGMRDNIDHAISFDGPGFSNEYLMSHAAQINAMSGKMDHYAWSAVGSLLFAVPGSNYMVIAANDPEGKEGLGQLLWRHDTPNVIMKNGHVIAGERDPLAFVLDHVSKGVELAATGSYSIAKAVSLGLINVVREGAIQLGQFFTDLYERFTRASGEYSVRPAALNEAEDELDMFRDYACRTAEEVEDIANSLQYDSIAGWGFKNQIRRIGRGIASDGEGAGRLGDSVSWCGQNYCTADNEVGDSLTL